MADDDALHRSRQGFWLRMARERAGKSQAGAAEYLGLSRTSKSTISDYENAVTEASQSHLRRLARWYGTPIRTFTEPDATAYERLDELAREAIAAAVLTVDSEEEAARDADALPGTQQGRRIA